MVDVSRVVIWSADVDETTLDTLLTHTLPLRYIKLDRLGLTRMGLDKISAVQAQGFQVFADAKIDEVPVKVAELATDHLRHRPWMLNVMAAICSTGDFTDSDPRRTDGLKRFADLCHSAGTKPCAVTVKTSKTSAMVAYEYNGRTPIEQVQVYAEMLLSAGFTDMVCLAQEAAAIRAESRLQGLTLNTPGIRMPGSDVRDQARVYTPARALAAGADRLVIGQDLTEGNLIENFEHIATHLNAP